MSKISTKSPVSVPSAKGAGYGSRLLKDLIYNRSLYLMVIPVIAYYVIFCYKPMYGAIIAFKEFTPMKGIMGSEWVGLKYFEEFFKSYYFWRILRNTVVISVTNLVFGFPAPIILALLINELKNKYFTKTVQTITYLPHFISMVVVCGLIKNFTMDTGIINDLMAFLGRERVTMLNYKEYFVPVYVISEIWQGIGWGSIIYLAALSGIDQQLYEAAEMDGAGKWKQTFVVTLPGILPTIVVMFILRMGAVLNVGFEKIILLYNPAIYETSDVISSFVYRKGLQEFSFSFSAAVGLFNSAINFGMLLAANWLSKKFNETSLW